LGKNVLLIFCSKKSFRLRVVKFCVDYHKTNTNRGDKRRLLAQTARMQLFVKPAHGIVEYDEKIVTLLLYSKQKVFYLWTGKFSIP
jgi:hypothetical protein